MYRNPELSPGQWKLVHAHKSTVHEELADLFPADRRFTPREAHRSLMCLTHLANSTSYDIVLAVLKSLVIDDVLKRQGNSFFYPKPR